MKKYILFAGVNGAGKSTLYQTNQQMFNMPRINLDEIVREFGSWKNSQDVIKAGKTAVKRLKDYLERGVSFNQETTLCGKSIVRNIEVAKQQGYQVEMYYVGLDSVQLAKERVKKRMMAGGHGIPEQDIERRYQESLEKLKRLIPYCDVLELYDNTESFTKIARYEKGICIEIKSELPEWVKTFVTKEIIDTVRKQ